jgi:hypothetical protein
MAGSERLEALQRVVTAQRPPAPRRASSAELIASEVEFETAARIAGEDERAIMDKARASTNVLDQMSAAIYARMILAQHMSDVELVRYVQHLQLRYEAAAGETAYAKYKATVPDDVYKDPVKLRAELQTLSYRLRLAYAVSHKRDRALSNIRQRCWMFLGVALAFVLAAVLYQGVTGESPPVLNYAIIAAIGFGGSITSIARRAHQLLSSSPLSEDPVVQVSALDEGAASLRIAAITGPVFALVVLLIFMSSGLKIDGLTPEFVSAAPHGGNPMDFRIFNHEVWLKDGVDGAKLAVWAFVSGFAEQFVPDVLDRFANAGSGKK